MRRAMAEAEVGDDVFQDDPTVRRLEEETAAVLGKEASLFVPSGCMGNECAFATLTREGDSILLERHSHPVLVEARAVTELLRRRFWPLPGERGRLTADQVAAALDGGGDAAPPTLVEVENTHNWSSGTIYPLDRLQAIGQAARDRGRPVHLDGARLWNASAATGVPPAAYAKCADTVMVCYSKGLGAPLGSAVAGSAAFVREAREIRRAFGGAMRQVGIVAAGALHALRHHRDRLGEDHRRARRLAEAIAETPGLRVDPAGIETNIVIVDLDAGPARLPTFIEMLATQGVLVVPFGGPGRFRAVTHLDVDDAGIDRAIAAIRGAAASYAAPSRAGRPAS
jgi:threonine aldolase